MRDLAFVGFLLGFMALGFRRPFLFVLVYVYIDIVSPQRLTYLLLNSVPISLIAVGLAVGGWLLADDKTDTRVAPRQFLLLLLLVYCYATTRTADFPVEALFKWDWVWKALAFAMFLPLTLRTRLRIESLLLFMILSLASIVIVGGIKTLASGGGGYGELNLMVSNNSGLFEGSIISAVSICVIPVILWLTNHGTIFKPDWRTKVFGYALVFACLLIPIGTSARTGLMCIGLLAVLLLRDVKRRLLYLGFLGVVGLAAIPMLPQSFTQRMDTIRTYNSDESASTRLAVWQWTIEYAKTHPFGGGFEAYRQNKIRYDMVSAAGKGGGKLQQTTEVDQARAYHSAYFEMLGEQGYFGLALWLVIHLTGLVRMEVIRRRYRKAPPDQAWIAPLGSALQQAHLIYLLGAAFVGIALNPFVFMLVGAQIGLDTYLTRKRAETAWQPLRRPPRHLPTPLPAATPLA